MTSYKGYAAKTEIDPESGLIFGEVIGVRDLITFQGTSVVEAMQAFRESVDLYLKTCSDHGLEPDQHYSGSIAVRTKPSVHRALVTMAKANSQSLNQLINQVLKRTIRRAGVEAGTAATPNATRGRRRPGQPSKSGT